MEYPTTTQELFDKFIKVTKFWIHEVGSPNKECKQLYKWAVDFAEMKNLNEPTKEECGIYYDDDFWD